MHVSNGNESTKTVAQVCRDVKLRPRFRDNCTVKRLDFVVFSDKDNKP